MMKKRVGADTSPYPTLSTTYKKMYPYLSEGVRIQYISREGATRSEIISHRDTNIIVAKNVLGKKTKIKIDRIVGYWPENVTPVSRNLLRIKNIKELVQLQFVVS